MCEVVEKIKDEGRLEGKAELVRKFKGELDIIHKKENKLYNR